MTEQIIKALEIAKGALSDGDIDMETFTALNNAINFINRQKTENERLKKNIDGLNIFTTNYTKVIRLQAIKEFVEKLTDKISVYSKYVDVDGIVILNRIFRMIEDIEKEMTEVKE